MMPSMRFSTRDVSDDKHQAWRDLGSPRMGDVFDAQPDPGFEAYSERICVGPVTLIFGWYGAQTVHRRTQEIERQPLDILCVTISGTMILEGPLYNILPGGICIVDFSKEFSHHSSAGSLVSIIIPKEYARNAGLDVDVLHAREIDAESAALLYQHVVATRLVAAILSESSGLRIARTIVDLLAVALDTPSIQLRRKTPSLSSAIKQRAEQIIIASVDPAAIDIDGLGRALSVSRSTLYQLYKSEGGVQHRIKRERLRRAQAALLQDDFSIGEIALHFGFHDSAHFAKAFRTAFGMSPSKWRNRDRAPIKNIKLDGAKNQS